MLPIEPGEILERRLWDSQILAAEHNPYELAPEAERLTAFRGENWEEMEDKSTPSSYFPNSSTAL